MGNANNMKMPFFQSAKFRVFLALFLIVVVIGAIALIVHWRSRSASDIASASVAGAPDIPSVAGAGTPSSAYIKAQTQANISGEETARKKATSFIPTITRSGFVGNPEQFGQSPDASGTTNTHCPINKVVLTYKPNPASCTPNNLKLARETGVTAEELLCQGCACPLLKSAGYTIGDLKQIGLTAAQLNQCGFNLQQLINAGYSVGDLKDAGFSAAQLKAAGLTADQLSNGGFPTTAPTVPAVSPKDLIGVNDKSPECNIEKLKQERAAGVSATELRQKGCGLAVLKAAGFSAGALRAAGFSAADLKAAGFTVADLKSAGFSAAALKTAGFTATDLKNAGYTAGELKSAGYTAGDLKAAGFSAGDLVSAGLTASQLKDAGYSPADLKAAGFSASDLSAAGLTAGQLASAGFDAADLKAAGFSATQLRDAGVSASALRSAGFTPDQLKIAGFTKGDLLRAGFSEADSGFQGAQPAMVPVTAPIVSTASKTPDSVLPSLDANSPEAKLVEFEKKQQAEMNRQQRQDHIERMQAMMAQQANNFMTGWSNFANQQIATAPESHSEQSASASSLSSAAAAATANKGPIIKAGTVLFAVIETSINSDEKTPIMAHIVTGELNGSKLLGTFTRVNKRLLISFSVLSEPSYPTSIPINAVAIDPDTARTAITGEVNSHYLLRYGTLFASAFLEGVSQGIINQGITSNCLISGFGCTVTQNPLTVNQQIAVGLGKVGQAYAQRMGENFTVPPTIRIPAGTGIGVLVMGDLHLPATTSAERGNTNG